MRYFEVAVIFLLTQQCFAVTSQDYEDDEKLDLHHQRYCMCVPYWQCKEDFSGFIEDGVDIMDVRVFRQYSNTEAPSCTGDFDVCCQIECGQRKAVVNVEYEDGADAVADHNTLGFRVLGDDETEFGEFPWMLGILQKKAYKCGASLIHPQVAITAAHCVDKPGPYKIRAGEWNWKSSDELLSHQDRMTSKIVIHPNYNHNTLANDIALIILEAPFKLAENVGVICLPLAGTKYDDTKCTASGWGKNNHKKGSYQSTLKKIDISIVPNKKCVRSLRNASLGQYFSLHNSFICAGGGRNKDTCKGDGGSPLFCPIEGQPNRYEQVGIVSWGLICGKYNTPGVYVNVALFRNWVDNQMLLNNFDTNIYRY